MSRLTRTGWIALAIASLAFPVRGAGLESLPGEITLDEATSSTMLSLESAAIPLADGSQFRDGVCQPFYKMPVQGGKKRKAAIRCYNRANEPAWYHTYRCEHFGYYPTQWAPWPDGWLQCRDPQPGPHPYDLKPPISNRTRSPTPPPRNSTANP